MERLNIPAPPVPFVRLVFATALWDFAVAANHLLPDTGRRHGSGAGQRCPQKLRRSSGGSPVLAREKAARRRQEIAT